MVTKNSNPQVCPKIIPTPDGEDIVSKGTEYFRINKAAEILGCTSDDLLHLGAIGKAEIMAPVISKGRFEWPIGSAGIAFPELDNPTQKEFNATDRVILSKIDLASIEAIGWTIPTFFYAPSSARKVIEDAQLWLGEATEQGEIHYITDETGEITRSSQLFSIAPYVVDNDLNELREISYFSPWHPVSSLEQDLNDTIIFPSIENNSEKTTINHLFISKKELQRLVSGQAQDDATAKRNMKINEEPVASNGHFERHARPQVLVLKAALYCLDRKSVV